MPTTAELPSMRMYSWSLVKRMAVSGIGSSGGIAVIAVGDEGERGDFGGLGAAAHRHGEASARRGEGRRYEAQGDGAAERGRKPAAGDRADAGAVGAENFGAVAGRRTIDQKADEDAGEIAGKF